MRFLGDGCVFLKKTTCRVKYVIRHGAQCSWRSSGGHPRFFLEHVLDDRAYAKKEL